MKLAAFIIVLSVGLAACWSDGTVISIKDGNNYLQECGSDCMSCSNSDELCFTGTSLTDSSRFIVTNHGCTHGSCISLKNKSSGKYNTRTICVGNTVTNYVTASSTGDGSTFQYWYVASVGSLYTIQNAATSYYVTNGGNVQSCTRVANLQAIAYNLNITSY